MRYAKLNANAIFTPLLYQTHSATTSFFYYYFPHKASVRIFGSFKNNSLLKENESSNSHKDKIPDFINKYSYLQEKGLCWKMVKMGIRAFSNSDFTVSPSKRKSFRSRQQEKDLLGKLNVLQKVLDCNFSLSTNKAVLSS